MRSFLCLLALFALAQAERDWSKIQIKEFNPVTKEIVKRPVTRIVGGQEAQRHSFPYQAALFILTPEGTFFCGGSLISPLYVLTAAHCVESGTQVEAILGAHNIYENEDTQVSRVSSEINIHAQWSATTLQNDVATIRLNNAAPINAQIQVLGVPSRQDTTTTFQGRNAVVAGWGRPSDEQQTISEVLQFVEVPVISNLLCGIQYLGIIQSSHICTSGSGGKGTCNGDSGGPLVIDNTVVGIVSFGLSLGCEIGWPAVFTRVTYFLDFIEATTDVTIPN